MAAGTFFQTMIAITTIIAREMKAGAFKPRKVGSGPSCDGTSVEVVVGCSDMEFRLHRVGSFRTIDLNAG